MKTWISGETHADVEEGFSAARLLVEEAVGAALCRKRYGKGLASWDLIPIIIPKSLLDDGWFREVVRYNRKKRDAEFRLQINFTKFNKGPQVVRVRLLCDLLRRTLDYIDDWGIEDFDAVRMRADFEAAVRPIESLDVK